MNDGEWLNDEAINLYMALLQVWGGDQLARGNHQSLGGQAGRKISVPRCGSTLAPLPSPLVQERDTTMRTDPPADGLDVPPKCHFFNSFFAGKLYRDTKRYSYEAVRKWTKEKKLKSYMQVVLMYTNL